MSTLTANPYSRTPGDSFDFFCFHVPCVFRTYDVPLVSSLCTPSLYKAYIAPSQSGTGKKAWRTCWAREAVGDRRTRWRCAHAGSENLGQNRHQFIARILRRCPKWDSEVVESQSAPKHHVEVDSPQGTQAPPWKTTPRV